MIKIITIITKFIVVTLMALLFSSCRHSINMGLGVNGSGNITTETRTVNQNFKAIEVSTGIKVIVEQSDKKAIMVETDDNLQKHITTKIENDILIIESDKNYNSTKTPLVSVKMPIISGLNANSGSKITNLGTVITENIYLESSSGSTININVEADNISIKSSSGSGVEASGKALKLETTASSGSNINAEKLMANEVISQTSSGSSTSVYPIIKLDAKASSGSNINYHNIPKSVSKKETLGGSIEQE